jgi:uncharacterized protein YbbK (DUF523 family)
MKLVSACLIGINCRYDGKSNTSRKCLKLFKNGGLIPVCPEQLGGLSTPREPAEIQKTGRVLKKNGKDVTKNFTRGAEETLKIAKYSGAKSAIFKARSPSCGSKLIFDGSFSRKLIKGDGITTALLKKNGIQVITEEDL